MSLLSLMLLHFSNFKSILSARVMLTRVNLQSSLDDIHRVLPKVEKSTASASVSCLRNDVNRSISL